MTYDIDTLRRVALMQHNNEPYFVYGGNIFPGDYEELHLQWKEEQDGLDFYDWLEQNVGAIEDLDAGGDPNYLVLTDGEADDHLDKYLDDYIDDVVLPEIPEPYRYYFDEEKWKRDAKFEGRGRFLAGYDGHEHEVTVEIGNQKEYFYIYKQ